MFNFASAISADARFLLITGQILYDLWCRLRTFYACCVFHGVVLVLLESVNTLV